MASLTGACTYGDQPRCTDFFFQERDGLRADQLCETSYRGTWSPGEVCPDSERVGRCTGLDSAGMPLLRFAYYAPLTTAEARALCVGEDFMFEEN